MNQKQWIQVDESSALNESRIRKSTALVSAVPALFAMSVCVVLGQWIAAVVVGIAISLLVNRIIRSASIGVLAGSVAVREIDDNEHSRLFNVIDGLCVVSGDQRPRMYAVETAYPVAAAFIDAEGENAILVSDAFMSTMDRVEVEGVMAHLLWRLRTGNVALVAHVAAVSAILGRVGLAPVGRRITESFVSPDIVMWADIFACQATRYPPALVSALEKCQAAEGVVELGPVNALCFALPSDTESDALTSAAASTLVSARSTIGERVAVLKEI
jgi:heat shock protein HtpX